MASAPAIDGITHGIHGLGSKESSFSPSSLGGSHISSIKGHLGQSWVGTGFVCGSNYGCDLGCGRAAGQMGVCAEVKVGRNESGSRSSSDRGQGFEGVEFGSGMLAIG